MAQASPTPTGTPPPLRRRIIAPDLARGLALFGIAWANVTTAWVTVDGNVPGSYFGGVFHGMADEIVVVLSAMFAHVRGLPMFTTLLGFGVGLIAASLSRRGRPPGQVRRVLLRRYFFLFVFGVAHCLLLFFGDILILYGVIGMVLALLIRLGDRTLLWLAGILFGIHLLTSLDTLLAGGAGAATVDLPPMDGYTDYVAHNAWWVYAYLVSAPMSMTTMLPLAILGLVAARRGVHADPQAYRRPLRAWVILAAAIVVGVGLPWGLAAIGVLPPGWEPTLGAVNQDLGYLTGPGIAAAILLGTQRLQQRVDAGGRLPAALAPVTALGQRSMTGYLTQSLLFFVIALPFTLDLGGGAGAAGLLLMAATVWVVTLLGAWALEVVDKPGPFEFVHRRLSYGKEDMPSGRRAWSR